MRLTLITLPKLSFSSILLAFSLHFYSASAFIWSLFYGNRAFSEIFCFQLDVMKMWLTLYAHIPLILLYCCCHSYPFSEDTKDGTSYMKTRCPSWCDRIMLSHAAAKVVAKVRHNIETHILFSKFWFLIVVFLFSWLKCLFYKLEWVCMCCVNVPGDYKAFYIKLKTHSSNSGGLRFLCPVGKT